MAHCKNSSLPQNISGAYFPVVIIGAGAAGLRAAFDLLELGLAPLVIEKNEKAGGRLLRLERWFTMDSCGLCRLLDSERRPLLPSGESDITCLRHTVAIKELSLLTGSRVLSVRQEESGMALDVDAGGGTKSEITCDCVIVSTGLDDTELDYLTHLRAGIDPDVVTAVRFEEMIARDAPRPLARPSDDRRIKRIAFIGCAGSRDTRHPWCSSSCCSFLTKEIKLLKEIDGSVETFLLCMDVRLSAKGMFPYGEEALKNTAVLRAKAGSIERRRGGDLSVRAVSEDEIEEIEVDLAVLSGGQKPSSDEIFSMLGVKTGNGGFPLPGMDIAAVSTSNPQVFTAGSCRNPCDISTSVMEGRACAAAAFELIKNKKPDICKGPGSSADVLVVGGGIAGLSAARTLSVTGQNVTLLEKETETGGLGREIKIDAWGRDMPARLAALEKDVSSRENIETISGAEALSLGGRPGSFVAVMQGRVLDGFDTVVAATGSGLHKDERLDGCRILTLREIESRLDRGAKIDGDVVFIQCSGSRDARHPYCNRVCCPKALMLATEIIRKHQARTWILYRDITTMGLDEGLYGEGRDAGIIFVRFDASRPPAIQPSSGGKILVEFEDKIIGKKFSINPEYVILSSGIDAPEEIPGRMLVPAAKDGFAAEDDPRFRPCQSSRPGVYVAGNARYPSSGREAALSGICAGIGASILAGLIRNKSYDVAPSRTKEKLCTGCGVCVDACPAGARYLDGAAGAAARVIEHLCQACGLCEASCPSGAADVPHMKLKI